MSLGQRIADTAPLCGSFSDLLRAQIRNAELAQKLLLVLVRFAIGPASLPVADLAVRLSPTRLGALEAKAGRRRHDAAAGTLFRVARYGFGQGRGARTEGETMTGEGSSA